MQGQAIPTPRPSSAATFAPMLRKAQGESRARSQMMSASEAEIRRTLPLATAAGYSDIFSPGTYLRAVVPDAVLELLREVDDLRSELGIQMTPPGQLLSEDELLAATTVLPGAAILALGRPSHWVRSMRKVAPALIKGLAATQHKSLMSMTSKFGIELAQAVDSQDPEQLALKLGEISKTILGLPPDDHDLFMSAQLAQNAVDKYFSLQAPTTND